MVRPLAWLTMITAARLGAQQPARSTALPISLTETAARLAENGAANHNPRTVMAAAEILRVAERGTVRVQRIGLAAGPTGPWDGPMTTASLLRLASSIAADQGDWASADYAAWLLQLPDSVPVTRGATSGPVWADAYLGAKSEVSYIIEFEGGQTPNLLQVSAAKPNAILECSLLEGDASGPVVMRLRSLGGTCSIEWQQTTRGNMLLRVRNVSAATFFVMSSN